MTKVGHLVRLPNLNKEVLMAGLQQQPSTSPEVTQEIEGKWLLHYLPRKIVEGEVPFKEILQGYVVISDNSEVRLRAKGDQYFLTVKTGSGLVRTEIETALTKEQFDTLWPSVEERVLSKRRYELTESGKKIEIDVYQGKLRGLIVAEVEFTSLAEARDFKAPCWFATNVTDDKAFKNQKLALTQKIPVVPK